MPHRVVDAACARRSIGYERGACGVAMRGAGGNMIDWAACAARTDHSVAANSAGCEPSRAGSMRLSSQGESLKRWRSRRSRRRRARRHTCRMWRTHKDATARLGGQSVLYARPARTRTQKSSIADLPGVKTTHSQYSVFCHKRTVRTPRRASESNRGYRGLSQPILGLVHHGKPSTSPWDSDNVPECINVTFFGFQCSRQYLPQRPEQLFSRARTALWDGCRIRSGTSHPIRESGYISRIL